MKKTTSRLALLIIYQLLGGCSGTTELNKEVAHLKASFDSGITHKSLNDGITNVRAAYELVTPSDPVRKLYEKWNQAATDVALRLDSDEAMWTRNVKLYGDTGLKQPVWNQFTVKMVRDFKRLNENLLDELLGRTEL